MNEVRPGVPVSWPEATTPIHEVGAARVRTYQCAACGKVEPWGPEWLWYGSYLNVDGGLPGRKNPPPMVVVCSEVCSYRADDMGLTKERRRGR